MRKTTPKGKPVCERAERPLFIVLSGPSGVGKDAVLEKMKQSDLPVKHVITMTTRSPRANEKDNINYHFVSTEKFQAMILNNELLEWAKVYGNFYGVPKEEIKQGLSQGQDVLVKVDIQGAATIKKLIPQAISIFLAPPSIEELFSRLKQRNTESSSDLALRMKIAEEDMKQLPLFDYVVVNAWNEIDLAVSQIKAIISAEKCWVSPREIVIN